MAKRMLIKKLVLGHGFSYFEVVKPSKATIHQLKQYIQHDKCEVTINHSEVGFFCMLCVKPVPQEVIEKGMTILCMRIM